MNDSASSTSSLRKRLSRLFRDREYRRAYVESFLNTSIAAQIKANRERRGWTQEQLAALTGMKQSRISSLENVNYESWSIKTLRRIAEAFDVVLVVRFESFGDALSGIDKFKHSNQFDSPPFEEDSAFHPAASDVSTTRFATDRIPVYKTWVSSSSGTAFTKKLEAPIVSLETIQAPGGTIRDQTTATATH